MKKTLTDLISAVYGGFIQSKASSGRYPTCNDITANNRIALNFNHIFVFKALDGGRSSISRGMGALATCNVDIPAAFFNIHKKGELKQVGGSL